MTDLQNQDTIQTWIFGETLVRTVQIENDTWFIAKDIAEIFEYRNAPDMTRYLDEDEKLIRSFSVSGQNRETTIISESGLYHAIFMSQNKIAKSFRKWVTSEVLPKIRKNGYYSAQADQYRLQITCDQIDTQKASAQARLITAQTKMLDKIQNLVEEGLISEKQYLPVVKDLMSRSRTLEPIAQIQRRKLSTIATITAFIADEIEITNNKEDFIAANYLFALYTSHYPKESVSEIAFRNQMQNLYNIEASEIKDESGCLCIAYTGIKHKTTRQLAEK